VVLATPEPFRTPAGGRACRLHSAADDSEDRMNQGTTGPVVAPLSTYRIQFNQTFTFRDAVDLVPYLKELGISWLYASPYLQARPGSLHGYDITNHARLNPEIGTPEEHVSLSRALQHHGMGQLVDIVPNHMGVGEANNDWWRDVLENGPSSMFAPFFDIDWEPLKPELAGKVLLPILGDQFGRVLENGELRIAFEEGRFGLHYHEHHLPVSPKSSTLILRDVLGRLGDRLDEDDAELVELESIVTALEHLPGRDRTDEKSVAERKRENVVSKRRLAALHESSDEFRSALEASIARFNGVVGEPHSFDLLERILSDQAYRLAFWRVAADEINYRRFFDINELAGVRVERPEVFQATHDFILGLVAEGRIDGLRIDHPDGLYDPTRYLEELQHECKRRADKALYVLVEKILTGEEPLSEDWPVAGTVGYEFLNQLNGLFVDASAESEMHAIYRDFVGREVDFNRLVYLRKTLILRMGLVSELNVLAYLLDRISESNRRHRDFTLGSLKDALRETIASFPVYRTYIDAERGRVSPKDREHVERAIRSAIRRNRATSRSVFDFIRDILLLRWPDDLDAEARERHARFVMKFQQLSGPVMAKGVEDTAFYIFNRLVSLNEVGGEPSHFGVAPHAFHRWIDRRFRSWPLSLNTTSTHDTKRSEDVRARIDVLSEIPSEWRAAVTGWAQTNQELKSSSEEGEVIPSANDEYLFYQTLIGAWPLDPMEAEPAAEFVERMQRYMEKATREAKIHTSWIDPNEEYDEGVRLFVAAVLSGVGNADGGGEFLSSFRAFQRRVERGGMLNSLSQTALKLTCPGVPDVYQGQEVWDFSLVDPDNRRPVDYDVRRGLLGEIVERIEAGEESHRIAGDLMRDWRRGGPKLYLIRTLLHLRNAHPELFQSGAYVPLGARGARADHVIAFHRSHAEREIIVVAPRLCLSLLGEGEDAMPAAGAWGDTALQEPQDILVGSWRGLLGGAEISGDGRGADRGLRLADILEHFPVEVLERTSR
jgi:(1->4)-alpha-D-glucan 1-alpha-D-glucosylmutase